MKTLIISDTHIGHLKFKNTARVREILETESYDRLVLNGDIIDLWIADLANVLEEPLYRLIVDIANKKEVIWIVGNHDYKIRQYIDRGLLPKAKFVDTLELEENNKKILILHGHQVYHNQNMSRINRLAYRFNYWLWRATGFDFQRMNNRRGWYKKYVDHKRLEVLKHYGNGIDTIIMGHTHLIGYKSRKGTALFDAGSSMFTRSYAVLENGTVWLKMERV